MGTECNLRVGHRSTRSAGQEGIALFYLAAMMFVLLSLTGLTIDLGRGYIVKANLSKAVDAAALAAARAIGNGQSQATIEANKIFQVNFPTGYMGVTSLQNPPVLSFSVAGDGTNFVDVSSTAVLPTTFMRVAGFSSMTVTSSGQAAKRLVDLSLVIDKSGSIGPAWPQVQSATTQFINYFDEAQDRVALIMYSSNTIVYDPISIPRGYS